MPTNNVWTETRKALALAHTIVALWAAWADDNEHLTEDAVQLALEGVRALDLNKVDGVLASPLNYFARACLDGDNPEDLTYVEMVQSIEISIGLDPS